MTNARRSLLALLGVALPAAAFAPGAKAATDGVTAGKHHAKKHVHAVSHTAKHHKPHHPATHIAPQA